MAADIAKLIAEGRGLFEALRSGAFSTIDDVKLWAFRNMETLLDALETALDDAATVGLLRTENRNLRGTISVLQADHINAGIDREARAQRDGLRAEVEKLRAENEAAKRTSATYIGIQQAYLDALNEQL